LKRPEVELKKWVRRDHYENEDGWLAYVVGIKDER